jgi:hypothetical protein
MAKIIEKFLILMFSMTFIIPGTYKLSSYVFALYQSNIFSGVVVKQGMGKYLGCKPFIEFYDDEGFKREVKSEINYHFFFCPKKGDKIKLIISRKDPLEIYSSNIAHYIIIPVILVSIGLLIIYSSFFKKVPRNENFTTSRSSKRA